MTQWCNFEGTNFIIALKIASLCRINACKIATLCLPPLPSPAHKMVQEEERRKKIHSVMPTKSVTDASRHARNKMNTHTQKQCIKPVEWNKFYSRIKRKKHKGIDSAINISWDDLQHLNERLFASYYNSNIVILIGQCARWVIPSCLLIPFHFDFHPRLGDN